MFVVAPPPPPPPPPSQTSLAFQRHLDFILDALDLLPAPNGRGARAFCDSAAKIAIAVVCLYVCMFVCVVVAVVLFVVGVVLIVIYGGAAAAAVFSPCV